LPSSEANIKDVDRLIHEPSRLMIMAQLYVVQSADFTFLLNQTEMTPGNLSAHLSKLEEAGYVEVTKEFIERKPHTALALTKKATRMIYYKKYTPIAITFFFSGFEFNG